MMKCLEFFEQRDSYRPLILQNIKYSIITLVIGFNITCLKATKADFLPFWSPTSASLSMDQKKYIPRVSIYYAWFNFTLIGPTPPYKSFQIHEFPNIYCALGFTSSTLALDFVVSLSLHSTNLHHVISWCSLCSCFVHT